MGGKDVSHLQQSVLDQFKYLDEDEDDDWGDLDMFTTTNNSEAAKLEKQLEKELNAAIKADKKQAGAAKLLKAAVNVDYDPTQDKDEEKLDVEMLEAQLEETLEFADDDVTDIQKKMDTIASMTGKTIKMDFDSMAVDDIVAHCEETWDEIEGNKDEQQNLKATQENVVGHLTETNEWLNSKSEILLSDIKDYAIIPLGSLDYSSNAFINITSLIRSSSMVLADLHSNTLFFDPVFGGDPVLYQHLF